MKTIYIGRDGKRMEMTESDIEVKVPVLLRYYDIMDSFSLFIDAKPEQYKQMKKNLKKSPERYKYMSTHFICPSKEFSNFDAWEIEDLENVPEDMKERLLHYWQGYTDYWFKTFCTSNTHMWRNNDTTLATKFYLNDTVIPEANNCTFFLSGEYNGIRFSQLSNVLIHIFGNYYEVE